MKKFLLVALVLALAAIGCGPPTSDDIQRQQQETILAEGTSRVGMPAIKNFRERKILKDILEKRDQERYVTYTYTYSEVTGKFTFYCHSIGYPLPYATQFTNPQKVGGGSSVGYYTMPQADPNGLFSPSSAEATWVMCKDPNSDKVGAVYTEPKVSTVPWPLPGVEIPGAIKIEPAATAATLKE